MHGLVGVLGQNIGAPVRRLFLLIIGSGDRGIALVIRGVDHFRPHRVVFRPPPKETGVKRLRRVPIAAIQFRPTVAPLRMLRHPHLLSPYSPDNRQPDFQFDPMESYTASGRFGLLTDLEISPGRYGPDR